MEDARIVVHIAGWPHEGQQTCRRCKQVLVDGSETPQPMLRPGFIAVAPGGEPAVMYRDAAACAGEIRCNARRAAA